MPIKEDIVITATDRTAAAFKAIGSNADVLQKRFSGLSIGALGIGTAVGLAAAGLVRMTKDALDNADAIGKAADKMGIGTDALQEYRYAASLAGVQTEQLDGAFGGFTKRLGEAQAGTGSLVEFLKKYDKALLDTVQNADSTEAALDAIFEGMAKAGTAADRAALSSAAFGADMSNMLREGTAGLAAMRQEAQELGIVLDEDLIRNAESANDELERLSSVVSMSMTQALVNFAPVIEETAGLLLTLSKNAKLAYADLFKSPEDMDLTEVSHQIDLSKAKVAELTATVEEAKASGMDFLPGFYVTEDQLKRERESLGIWQARHDMLKHLPDTPGGGGTGGGGGGIDDVIAKERARAEAWLQAIEETNMQVMGREAELIDMRAAQELEKLGELYDKKLISADEYAAAEAFIYDTKAENQRQLEEKITENLETELDKRIALEIEASEKMAKAELAARQNLMKGLDAIASLQNVKSRQAFEIGKAASASIALIKTYEGAQGAYASAAQVPIIGYLLAPIAAAAATIAGLANVRSILSTSYGSTSAGGGGGGGGGVSMPTPPINEVPALAPANDTGPMRIVNLTITGTTINAESIRSEVIPLINEAAEDGVPIKINVTTAA